MKCPVCSTRVEDNIVICPNCGMTLKKDSSQIQETPKTNIKEKPKYLRRDLTTTQKMTRIIRVLIIGVVLVAIVIFAGIPIIRSVADNYNYSKIADMTFEEVINEGYDTKNTVSHLMTYMEDFKEYTDQKGYKIDFINETCSQERSSKPLIASSSFIVTIEENRYYADVTITFMNGELYSTKLGYSGIGILNNEFNVDKEEVEPVAGKLGMDNAYETLYKAYNNVTEVEDGKYVFNDLLDGYDINIEIVNQYVANVYIGADSSYSIEKVWVN